MKQRLIYFSLLLTILVSLCACKKQLSPTQSPSAMKPESTVTVTPQATVTSKLLAPKSSKFALYNCKIIDGNGSTIEKGVLLINQDEIEQVGTADQLSIPDEYEKVDLGGRTVLPGFINTHVHNAYDETNVQNWLKGGVTTVRDLTILNMGIESTYLKIRDDFNKRNDTSRVISATPNLTVPNGYGISYFNSTEEAKNLVNKYIKMGVDLVKFSICDYQAGQSYSMPTKEEMKAIVDTAHENGKRVVTHISQTKYLQLAAELGVDEVVHMTVEPIDDNICEVFEQKNIYWIPTLELWSRVSKEYHVAYQNITVNNLGQFYKTSKKIALGTDYNGIPNATFDQGFPITEVILMKQAGMSNMDIIMAGTKNAAYVCGREKDLGTLEKGKIADILIVDGDPLKTIEDLQNTSMVIHNGEVAFQK